MMFQRGRRFLGGFAVALVFCAVVASGCGTITVGTKTIIPTATAAATSAPSTPAPTATPQPPCLSFVPGSVPFSSLAGVGGIQMPAGTYISGSVTSGGGVGQYAIATYTACFQGDASAIDGGVLTPSSPPSSTIGYLIHSGWTLNNLFPDPTNFAYLDYCSNAHNCLNNAGTPNPFTFVGFDQYASHSGGFTTVRIQVATIAAPLCLNDPHYYAGTPKYTLYEDGNSASGNTVYHFLMPPATRVSTFLGGGTAGSTYEYFCSAGTQATIVSFLKQAMQNIGYSISSATASGFTATTGTGPTYMIAVSVQDPGNYYLRVFVPM